MIRACRPALVFAAALLASGSAHAGPIPLTEVFARAVVWNADGTETEDSRTDSTVAVANVSTAPYEEVNAQAFQASDGNSRVNVTSGPLASGVDGQVRGLAETGAVSRFEVTAPGDDYFFDFRLSGISLGVDGDYGGSGPPNVNPFDDPSAHTVGARVRFSVRLVNLDIFSQTYLFQAGMDLWGHGGTNTTDRYYQIDNVENMTATVTDQSCDQFGCYGKQADISPISRSLQLPTLTPGRYMVDILMSAAIAGRPFENLAWARINDPNGLTSFSLRSQPSQPSPVPEPSSLLLLGAAALGLPRVARRRPTR